ncbi:hypothetical protein D3C81_1299290 [compost metagenome]
MVNIKMFKFQTILSGYGNWAANLFKEDAHIGGIGIQEEFLYVNIHKGKELTTKEIMLLFTQLLQNDSSLLDKKFEINIVEEVK